ncbi:MAG: hypothetical protein DRQ56_07330 [Gammaproteobacteria bacterium]|nr:MAG: hypothetical protein DRQ56_07330 [Gammaproteobacteria bacterium]
MNKLFLIILSIMLPGTFGQAVALPLDKGVGEVKEILPATDCTEVKIDYVGDMTLTREEKLERMDQALFKSLHKFDSCQSTAAGGSTSQGGGGSSGGSGAEGGDGSSPSNAAQGESESSYANGVSGEGEPSDTSAAAQNGSAMEQIGNGKIPEDIPPADNDSALEAQIRHAAMNESDPEIRAKLWNEYRKYKGISKGENGGK